MSLNIRPVNRKVNYPCTCLQINYMDSVHLNVKHLASVSTSVAYALSVHFFLYLFPPKISGFFAKVYVEIIRNIVFLCHN